jgi:hypothetical protein
LIGKTLRFVILIRKVVKMIFYPTHSDMNYNFDPFENASFEDCNDKYIVIKVEDVISKLNSRELRVLCRYLDKLKNKNKYWVVNTKEVYAKEVSKLIFKK